MVAVTICSNFGAPKIKLRHCFHCFSIYLPWSDGTRCHDLCFLTIEPTFSLSFFTLIKRLFSSSSLSAIRVVSSSYLNEILAGYSNLGCRLCSFITLSMSCHSLLAWRVSIDRSALILMGIPLCVICCFSLAAFVSKFNIPLCQQVL